MTENLRTQMAGAPEEGATGVEAQGQERLTASASPAGGVDRARIEAAVRELLIGIGEDPDRPGLVGTPDRVARACEELFSGLADDPARHLRKQFHEEGNEELVVVRDIPFHSMCEHHILPFIGRAHVAYIPRDGRITGLSKIARCVAGFAARPQLQERLTGQVADAMMAELDPVGVMVVIEAEHTCMTMRGIRAAGAMTVTSAVRGTLKTDNKTREEALRLLGR
ncbi:GTP cyclohydrolase I FolE [uncultured Parolsenella sp.]|uniref:GTP cyclohydrolase I FolE n=1 Tax=uncultured Parolsenella sp. TaxID=2083008 RepID=UPI0025FB744E|nr:GTP cyclohydrolase I FolE [uncultured Parolsenella sp.]